MARRKLDNIERIMVEAERMGYGPHYGKCVADHPELLVPAPETKVNKPAARLPSDMIPCRHCGKLFAAEECGHTKNARFCIDDCRCESDRIRQRSYYHAKKEAERN